MMKSIWAGCALIWLGGIWTAGGEAAENLPPRQGGGEVVYVDAGNPVAGDGSPENPYQKIQTAIDNAGDFSEIIVRPGTYPERVVLAKTGVTLRSTNPDDDEIVSNTIITKSEASFATMLTIDGNNHTECTVAGLTFSNGYHGIYLANADSSMRIVNCVIKWNHYGLQIHGGSPRIERCRIESNSPFSLNTQPPTGAGIIVNAGSPTIQDCLILRNSVCRAPGILINDATPVLLNTIFAFNISHFYTMSAYYANGKASAIMGGNPGSIVSHCVFYRNHGDFRPPYVSGSMIESYQGVVENCIVFENYGTEFVDSSIPTYSCIDKGVSGGEGNLFQDPKFVDAENGDFHLRFDSPCIDAGKATDGLSLDMEGNPRGRKGVWEERGDGSYTDIGPFEYQRYSASVVPGEWSYYD